jgi:hypothetical protein
MVTGEGIPKICWEENLGPDEMRRVSDGIVCGLTSRLALPMERNRLFFVIPTPSPYAKAEAEMLSALATACTLRLVRLPKGGRCYVVSDESGFRLLIPLAFRLGPPELTLFAANCDFGAAAEEEQIASFVLNVLRDSSSLAGQDVAGFHFDSGDLLSAF